MGQFINDAMSRSLLICTLISENQVLFSEFRVQFKRLSKGREGVNNRQSLDNTDNEQLINDRIEINSIGVYHRILLQKSIYPLFSCLHKSSIRLINISMNESSPFILFKITDIEMYQTRYHTLYNVLLRIARNLLETRGKHQN